MDKIIIIKFRYNNDTDIKDTYAIIEKYVANELIKVLNSMIKILTYGRKYTLLSNKLILSGTWKILHK